MKRNVKLMLALSAAAAVLAACGGGDDSPPIVATTDAVLAASPTTVVATQGAPFLFPSGVAALGTTATTTVAFSGTGTTPLFKIEQAGGGTAEGTTTFGSCIFNVVSSSFAPPHPLQQGATVTVDPCNLVLDTDGQNANGVALTTEMQLQLGSQLSTELGATVAITASGEVILNGQSVGSVQVQETTGGGG